MWLFALALLSDSVQVFDIPLTPAESVHVTVSGQGNPVVLLPGLFGSAFAFRNLTPLLVDAGYRTIIVEPLGLGASARPRDADYSLAAQARRVAAALDSLRVGSALVIAHSVGASVAYRVAVHRPDLVAGILSLDGGPAEAIGTPAFRRAMRFARVIRMGGVRLVRYQIRRRLAGASGDATWVTEEVVDGYTADAARNLGATLAVFAEMAKAKEPYRLAPLLPRVLCPVRLLIGTVEDRGGISPEETALLRNTLPALTVENLPGVGHFIYEERPQAVLDALRRLDATRQAVATATDS